MTYGAFAMPPGFATMTCLYTISIAEGDKWTVSFAGTAPVPRLMELEQAHYNVGMSGMLKSDKPMLLTVVSYHADYMDADVALSACIDIERPYFNIHAKYKPMERKTGILQCVKTGRYYKNQAAAARHNNITPAQMSNHLRGNPRQIRGMVFVHVTDTQLPLDAKIIE